jgi:phytoene/squalene synthetase
MARKTSFYYAFLVLPKDQRHAIVAVWDFCRAVDDDVDEAEEGPAPAGRRSAREAVDFWRAELARCFAGATPETPQGRKLQPFITTFNLPREAFDDVIDGVAMDLDTTRYQTFDELLVYCRRVASAVGMICIRIFRCRSAEARDYALNLGIALQLTNIIRDVKDDLDRGRVYLPLDDLAAAGCTVADLASASAFAATAFDRAASADKSGHASELTASADKSGEVSELAASADKPGAGSGLGASADKFAATAFDKAAPADTSGHVSNLAATADKAGQISEPVRRLLAFQCDRARHFYQLAMAARPEEDRRRLVAAEIMRAVYFETLKRIEGRDYDVFSSRTRVPKPRQALIAIRQWVFRS